MEKKGSQDGSNKDLDRVIPFDQEKEKFMGMIGDVLSNKEFSSPEEANKFLDEAFTGRSMTDSLAEWDTRPPPPLDEAREVLNGMSDDATSTTERRYAKKSLEISKDCMEAWETLAWSYQSPEKIESTLLEGIAQGRKFHAELISAVGEDHGLWGYHEARPFMRLLHSLAHFYNQNGPLENLVETYEEMLSLNPGDNQGIRGELLHRYLCNGNLSKAEKLLEQFSDDIDLGIVYGRVQFELIKILENDSGLSSMPSMPRNGCVPLSSFGPPYAKAKALMKEALKMNRYVPLLMSHPTSLYAEPPSSYQIGSPLQALTFIHDHGLDWVSSMIGWFFLTAYEHQAEILTRKDRRNMREEYQNVLKSLKEIDEPPWQEYVLDQIEKNRE